MFSLSFHELWVSAVVASLVYVAVVASGASVLVSSVVAFSAAGASAAGSTFWASVSVLTASFGLDPGLYIDTLSLECMLIPKLT
jgi:hypothetical protein